ncbi:MAG: S8 family serine peptidase, partial [Methanoculleus sp.]|nr:S8 family serine peptidase [Methanoculleus sp.]
GYSQALKDAIDATPALVVCSAGNEALDNDAEPHYPSSYTSNNLLAVAAGTNTEQLASFSNFGATSVDVAAPGQYIRSTCVSPNLVAAYYDTMDSLSAWSADAPWGLNTVYYTSAPSAADDSPAGYYSPNTSAWLFMKEPIDLEGLQGTRLVFNARYDLEDSYDKLYIVSSPDGVTYYSHGYLSGSSEGEWLSFAVPLDMYDGGPVYIGFYLATDGSIQKSGVLIDDVLVQGIESLSADYAYYSGTSMATPHVSGVAGLVRSANASMSATEIKDVIINTVDTKLAYTGKVVSGGRVNAYSAVNAAAPATGQPPSIVSNKDIVTRSYCFTVTVSGEPSRSYWLYVRDAGLSSAGDYPLIAPNQVGVAPGVDMAGITDATNFTYTRAQITTSLSGTRWIQFNTTCFTNDQSFTITVVDPADTTISDDVVVTVEQGSVTLTASGTGVYYIGEEITLSGTNTDSYTTHLFLTGPNLSTNGVRLDNLGVPVMDNTPATFTRVDVEADDTWSYRWDTASLNRTLNSGGYTIYAVSTPRDKAHLSDAVYATATIQLRPPFVTAGVSNATLIPGDECRITGVAGGAPPNVNIWIFGPDYYGGDNGALRVWVANVEADGTFYFLYGTDMFQEGEYYVVVQHPGDYNFGVLADPASGVIYGEGIANVTLTALQPYDAAIALITALDSPDVDDIYARLTFEVVSSTPQAHFAANITNGTTPLTVQFTDASTGSPASWSWSFGDGSTSMEQHPTHTYTVPGVYNVGLIVSNSAGNDTETKSGYITATAPVQNTLSFDPPSSEIRTTETTEYNIVLDTVPDGLSGYNITVALTDPSVGEIVGVSYPGWANMPVSSSLPADTVYAQAVDLAGSVGAGATNVTLCTLTVRGDAPGTTNLTITATKVDDDVGNRYAPVVVDATLTVQNILPFPNPAGGTFPPATDLNGDGRYEDLDGNGFVGFNDVVVYYQNMGFIESSQPLNAFDYDGSGFVGFNDVVSLYGMV